MEYHLLRNFSEGLDCVIGIFEAGFVLRRELLRVQSECVLIRNREQVSEELPCAGDQVFRMPRVDDVGYDVMLGTRSQESSYVVIEGRQRSVSPRRVPAVQLREEYRCFVLRSMRQSQEMLCTEKENCFNNNFKAKQATKWRM